MSQRHEQRAAELIAHSAAEFIARESSGKSLITVTHAMLGSHGDSAEIFVSVFPESEGRTALLFLNRLAGDFRNHLHKASRLNPLPRIEFLLDDRSREKPLDAASVIP